jgi:hypothetical protein
MPEPSPDDQLLRWWGEQGQLHVDGYSEPGKYSFFSSVIPYFIYNVGIFQSRILVMEEPERTPWNLGTQRIAVALLCCILTPLHLSCHITIDPSNLRLLLGVVFMCREEGERP